MKDRPMDDIYRKIPAGRIPWNVETPPDVLVELVEGGRVLPCKTIDLGCGAGNYAIYLAEKGFDVTGVDISQRAIEIARRNAKKRGVECEFRVADVLGDLESIEGPFDFAYDWELLHHIHPENRERFVQNVYSVLHPGSQYLSVCFSVKDPQFGGEGKFRRTSIGTILYFSSEEELRELFSPFFEIIELKTIEIRGKSNPHQANYAFMVRK